MNGPTRRLAAAMFGGFGLLLIAATWFQVIGADRYRSDPRNARTAISLTTKERGLIVSADGVILAQSVRVPDNASAYARSYPAGEAFTPVVGYASRLVGDAGVEAAYASDLRSRRDLTISDAISALFGRDLRPRTIQLTIDAGLQRAAFQALEGQRGAVVALDPETGAVLAYVSSPSYDASDFLGSNAVESRQALLDRSDQPLRDRAGRELYAPGSTFKTVVAAAAFDAGAAGPETEYPDPVQLELPGSSATIRNFSRIACADGVSVSVVTAFVKSCNTTFAQIAMEIGAEEVGRSAAGLGFGRAIEFPWELAVASFPVRELLNDLPALAQSAIGERDVKASPLVMAMVAAGVANGGEVMEPHLLATVFDADGNQVRNSRPRTLARAMSPATATVLRQMMERAVTEGTGSRASIPGVRGGGKTGTAERPGGAPHVWFIGFAPADDPTIALAVLVEEGGFAGDTATGGSVAAPIARKVIEAWLTG